MRPSAAHRTTQDQATHSRPSAPSSLRTCSPLTQFYRPRSATPTPLRASARPRQVQRLQRRQLPEALRQRRQIVLMPEGAMRPSAALRTSLDHATHSRPSAHSSLRTCSPLAQLYRPRSATTTLPRESARPRQIQILQPTQLPEARRQRRQLVARPEGAMRSSAALRTTLDQATHSRPSVHSSLRTCSPLAQFYRPRSATATPLRASARPRQVQILQRRQLPEALRQRCQLIH